MKARVRPSVVLGTIRAPPSKSYTHREFVAGFLAGAGSYVVHPSLSDDAAATLEGLRSLGTRIRITKAGCDLRGAPVAGSGGPPVQIDCRRSGTTFRFLCATASLFDREVTLTGHSELAARPIEPLLEVLERAGARVRRPRAGRSLPLRIRGPIGAVRAELDASESSQFLSALLLVLPVLEGCSEIRIRGRLVSRPYVAASLYVMRMHGVRATERAHTYRVPGAQSYSGGRAGVPGDASSAAYLWAAAAVSGGKVRVVGLPPGPPQADLGILGILRRMGARVAWREDGATVAGNDLRGVAVDLTDMPDLYPLVGVLGAFARGSTRIVGGLHARRKESDRRRTTADLAHALGARVRSRPNSLVIEGRAGPLPLHGARYSDHRIVMSAAVAALGASGPSIIGGSDAVTKSYPGFWTDLTGLGASIRLSRT